MNQRAKNLDLFGISEHRFETEFQDSVSSAICGVKKLLMSDAAELKRVAFSPGEFAKLFGKSQTWGYQQIYGGKVKAITQHGRILIPAAEVEAILQTAGVYDGAKPKPAKTKAEMQKLTPALSNAWRSFLHARRQAMPSNSSKAAPALRR